MKNAHGIVSTVTRSADHVNVDDIAIRLRHRAFFHVRERAAFACGACAKGEERYRRPPESNQNLRAAG